MAIDTVVVHNTRATPVKLPAHPFAAHRLQRVCLTKRQLTRARLTPVLQARRALNNAPAVPARVRRPELELRAHRSVLASLASVALMVAMVAVACWATGLLHR